MVAESIFISRLGDKLEKHILLNVNTITVALLKLNWIKLQMDTNVRLL